MNVTDAAALAPTFDVLRLDRHARRPRARRGRRLSASRRGSRCRRSPSRAPGPENDCARKRDGRHGDVRASRRRDRAPASRVALGEVDVFGAGPAGALEVADEDRLAARAASSAAGCSRRASAPGRSASSRRQLSRCRSPTSSRPRSDGRAHALFGVAAEEDERRAIVAAERVDGLMRRVLRLLPVIAVAHARRVVEQDHDLARAADAAAAAAASCLRNGRANAEHDQQRAPRSASAAAPSGGSAAGAPTDTESSARTSATETGSRASARAGSDARRSGWRSPREAEQEQGSQK